MTGNKSLDKKYYRHTGFPGGIRETNFEKLVAHKPEEIFQRAVKACCQRSSWLCNDQKMKVYAGTEHPHTAQQPQVLDI